jgi:parallel beta-helix repeat protein
VEYGGNGDNNSNVYCASASPALQHCIIRNSDGYGIYTTGSAAAPLISCSALTNNNYGVYATASSDPTVVDCRITGNTSYGIYSDISSITIDAENNWWGNASGPSGAGPGTGDAVSSYVDFTPWRTAFDSCLETIALSPVSATNIVGSQHTVTATVEDESAEPIEGIKVSFDITFGPHLGGNGTDTTDSNGQATFTYTGTSVGDDTIEASFVDFYGRTITSNAVTKTWEVISTPQRTLTVTKAGTGAGTVTSNPAGIDCGADCDEGSITKAHP